MALADELQESAIDAAFKQHSDVSSDFFKQAEQAFAAAEIAKSAAVVSPGTSSAQTLTPAAPAAPAAAPSSSGKVQGLGDAPDGSQPAASTPASDPIAEQFKDVPREYKQGEIKAEKWNKLHQKADAYAAEVARVKAEIETLKKAGPAQPPADLVEQLKVLASERDEAHRRLEAVAFERSPKFEAQFKPRQESALAIAKDAVGPGQAEKVAELLQSPPSKYRTTQLNEVMKDLEPLDQQRLGIAMVELDKLNHERTELSKRGSEVWKQWQAEEQQAIQAHRQRQSTEAQQAFEAELASWQKATDLLRTKDGDANHNSAVQNRLEVAKNLFSGNVDFRDMSKAVLWAAIGPELRQTALAAQKRITELEAENARLKGSQPGNAGDAGGSMSASDDVPQNLGYAEGILEMARREGVRLPG